ncbi:MAG: glycosyltransferase [Planctomycetota bacterium]
MARVSFVVPAYNEELLLPRTLAALRDASAVLGGAGHDAEIIVADDASEDRTAEIAEASGATVVRVRNRQIAATRNAGAARATGDILVFVDADSIVPPDAAVAAVGALEAGYAYGACPIRFDGRVSRTVRVLLWLMMLGYRVLGLSSGAFLFCTREAFDAAGGFDERYYAAEETILARRLRRIGRYAWIRHPVTTSARKIRTYTLLELFGELARLCVRGPGHVRKRGGLDLWYGPRRTDPDPLGDACGSARGRAKAAEAEAR